MIAIPPSPRHSQRGVTRFEAGLIAVALTLTVSGSLYALTKSRANDRVESSERAAALILKAATEYVSEEGAGCPTVSSLKRDNFLEGTASASDAWGARFRILCGDAEVTVLSAGADSTDDSHDDVRLSRPRS